MKRILWAVALPMLALAATAQTLKHELIVPASPLQVYNALVVDWQVKQWSRAQAVVADARPGGVWRWSWHPDQYDEGVYEAAERPWRLAFSHLVHGFTTWADIEIASVGDSTRISVSHELVTDSTGEFNVPATAEGFWATVLPRLQSYLECFPGGYIAYPTSAERRPGVLVLHDRFGVNRSVRSLCDSLAAAGYVAVAADMFRGEVTADLAQATRFVELVNADEARAAAERGLTCLREDSTVRAKRLAVWGVGFGSKVALELAARDPRVRAVVIWQEGSAPDVETLRRLGAPVFALFADADVNRPRGEITAFSQQLAQAGVRNEIVILAGRRDFSDPGYGSGYAANVISEGWQRSRLFLDKELRLP